MLRPYIVVVPSVVIVPTLTDSALTVADDDNAVHVVGHDGEGIQGNGREMLRNPTPAFLRNASGRTEAHASRDHLSEHVATLLETNGHVVGSGARVIIPTEPDRLPVADDDNAVHVVGHDGEGIQGNGREMLRNPTPAFLRNASGRTEAHASRDHLSEHVATLLETNGHVVGSGARVIIPTEPDRLP